MFKIALLWLLHLLGIIIFMKGFFQMKSNQEGFARKDELSSEPFTNFSNHYTFSLKNMVLIIIDALRTDFVTNEKSKMNFPYLKKMLVEKKAILFDAKAHHPTVTLPRIKAITSGGIPGFMDVVYNFHSTQFDDDNIVTQSVLNGKNVIFYGDDTWLKLFPHHFKRSEGTTSFFVSDYTEVDNNVTENVKNELGRTDWDFLILHYLGLDHIGHKEGPFSALVPPKLKEMDEIIEKIHTELQTRDDPSMIIVCGDHGMSDSGNHGGASKEETSVPLIFIHNKNRFNTQSIKDVNQISITPTLSVMLNLPIPKNNLGVILSDVLIDLKPRDKLYAMFMNFNQMSKLKDDNNFLLNHEAVKMHEKWLEKYNKNSLHDDITNEMEVYRLAISYLNEELSENLTNIDFRFVLLGVFIVWVVFYVALYIQLKELMQKLKHKNKIIYLLDKLNFCTWILHSLSFFSSSFIEEEHMLWYYYSATLHFVFLLESLKEKNIKHCSHVILSWICSRFMRNWNQTGDKWASLADFNKWINMPKNSICLSITLLCGISLIFLMRYKHFKSDLLSLSLSFTGFVLIYICKISELYKLSHLDFNRNFPVLPGMIYFSMTLITIKNLSMSSLITSWLMLSSFLMRPHNVALLALMNLQEYFISQFLPVKNSKRMMCVYYGLAMTSFFYQGNSNSLSRIDVATGFIGLSEYNPILVAFLLICHTYSGFIFWIFSLLFRLNHHKIRFSDRISSMLSLFCLIRSLPVAITVLTLTLLKNHLFVWSVFSPKLLYESFHSFLASFILFLLWLTVRLHD